ncbi:MAG: universal stress protein [Caldilineaceae bacterium]|nr:universal stress protein [Caldilineaceae bacterium]
MVFQKILVPLDGSLLAEKALPYAIWLSKQSSGQLVFLRVVPSPVIAPARYSIAEADAWLVRQSEERREAEEYLAAMAARPDLQPLRPHPVIYEGDAAEMIVRAAGHLGVDAIILSTRARGGLARWILGSVADHVVQNTAIPVLLIREEEAAE